MKNFRSIQFLLFITLILNSCANFKPQYSNDYKNWASKTQFINKKSKKIFLIGDAGNLTINSTLQQLSNDLNDENENSTVIFLGDNIYPKGVPLKKDKNYSTAIQKLQTQLNTVKNFKGNTFFIPGNHDWYHGLNGLKEQEKLVEKSLGKNSFIPQNGCPLDKVEVNDQVDMIVIDSQWYLSNWDKHPTINDKCDIIKTPRKFFIELEGLINKSQGKILLIAMHHPTKSVGTHGGNSTFKSHIFPFNNLLPLPILGSFIQLLRKTSGINPQDIQARKYKQLINRVSTLAKEHSNTIFVSGHDHNLQYLSKNGIPQIISGSGSKTSATRLGKNKGFSLGANGYAVLSIHNNRQVDVSFKSNLKKVFTTTVFKAPTPNNKNYPTDFKPTKTSSIYTTKETTKTDFYKKIWGHHYRKYYSTNVEIPTVKLDTLFGGLRVLKKGGGHQSKSIRLVNPEGKQYVMRALRKSAVRFLQTVAFQEDYIATEMENTYTENLMFDFYTAAHPYTPFIVGHLSDPIGIYHTNPKIFYIPKQNILGDLNNEFGDALYMIEERPSDEHQNVKSFGYTNKIISTDDLFTKLRKNKNHILDEKNYVKARLFDMVIGDWDRHVDQWRWASFKEKDQTIYRPIPRDRDQAFSSYDGSILEAITTIYDPVKLMQTYKNEIRNLYKFNDEPYPIDLSLVQQHDLNIWVEQALSIKEQLTDEVIDFAFSQMPPEIQDKTIDEIKRILKYRRDHVVDIANDYQKILEKFAIIKGTDKDDWFTIESNKEQTKISYHNIKEGKKDKKHFTRTFNHNKTKEIWIYGLDDDDVFKVISSHSKAPKIRLIGGQNKDTYILGKSKNIYVHDFKSKPNEITGNGYLRLTDQYDKNVYQFRKVKKNAKYILPVLGYNPDDGFNFGASYNFTHKGFNNQPFMFNHRIKAQYFTATKGFDFNYHTEVATYAKNWNVIFDTHLTSSNFSNNFFGLGNQTINNDDKDGYNFNRVKTEIKSFQPGIKWDNQLGARFKAVIPLDIYEIESTENRFLNTQNINFDSQTFTGILTHFHFENYDNQALPSLGMSFNLHTNWNYNLSKNSSLGTIATDLGFVHPISYSKYWVISTKLRGQLNIGDEAQLYQSAFIGGNNGLRGFRNERFAGKRAFSQNTDIRYTISHTKTPILPLTYGVAFGYDYGRVWIPQEKSDRWHQSYGLSLWGSFTGATHVNLGAFYSKEGLRAVFGFGITL